MLGNSDAVFNPRVDGLHGGLIMKRSLASCILDMAIAAYHGGNEYVVDIALSNMKKVSKSNRIYLKSIINSPNPAIIVLKAIDLVGDAA